MKLSTFQWRSLKTRVTLFTLAIFLTGIWSLTFYAGRILREDLQRLLGDQQFSTVSLLAAQVNQELGDRFNALEYVAASVSPAMLGNPATLQALLEQRAHFQSLFSGGVIALGLDGTVIADVPRSTGRIGLNLMNSDSIATTLKQGKAATGRPVMGRKLRTPIFDMTVPIRNAQGKVIGALVGVIDLSKPNFLDKITESRYGKTGGYLLVERDTRMIVTATDKRRIMEALPAPGISPLIDRFMQGFEGYGVFVNPLGVEVLSSSKDVPVAGWNLAALLPTDEVFAPIRAMQQRMLLAAIFFTLLAGGLTWWLSQWMLRRQLSPMLDATRALAKLSVTNQPLTPLPITGQDEIGELIGGFNSLLDTLAQRETLLRQILDTSSVAIFLVDKEGRITQANQRMAEMFGCSVDELVGNEYVALVHPTERDAGRQKMLALLASEIASVDLERLYWRADHTEFWGNLTGKRFIDASGQDRGLVGVIADITRRKRMEEELRRQNNLLSAIIENFPGGISVIDADLRLVAHNALFKQLLDFPDSLFEKPDIRFEDFIRFNVERGEYGPGDTEQQVAEIVARARQFQPHEIERVCSSGTALEIRGMPLPDGGFVTVYLDITERKQMEEQVLELAFYDSLTKLPNRRLLNDRLIRAMAASKRSGCYGALMFLDLDTFKSLNDTHGHEVGDLLLIEAADRLKRCVREMDTVARFGGDEFVVVLSELDEDKTESIAQACSVAEKIRITLAELYRLTVRREGRPDITVEHHCSCSIGVTLFINHEASPDELLNWADAAMYQAKDAGRNLIRVYAPIL